MANRALAYLLGFLILWVALRFIRTVRTRQALLLVASYAFYASWGLWFLAVLIVSSLVNFWLGVYLRRRPSVGRLWLGILFNVCLLATFKYLPALANSAASQNTVVGFFRSMVLPLGISFWTFAALGYLFDVYREEELDPALIEFCLFLSFWPTVFAGPICRLPEMLPQYRSVRQSTLNELGAGLQRVLTGVAMMALARLVGQGFIPGAGVDAGFARTTSAWHGADVWCLAIGYGFQLFFDFAGYSHLVIGAAQALGFRLPENFALPYLSRNPSVFWTGWHMSLSFWIRDYLFLPMVMLRRERWWPHFTLFLSMVIFGLWHKASWTFIVWGAYQGALLVVHRIWQRWRSGSAFALPKRIAEFVSWGFTFLAVSVGWVVFHARDLHQALAMLKALAVPASYRVAQLPRKTYLLVAMAGLGYFAVVGVAKLLTHFAEGRGSLADVAPPVPGSDVRLEWLGRDRWVWVVPIAAVLSIYGLVIFHTQQRVASPMLYRLF